MSELASVRLALGLAVLFSIGPLLRAQQPDPIPPFQSGEWQTRFVEAWQSRDSNRVRDLYSKIYANAGTSREDVVALARSLFRQNPGLNCHYRILSFRQFPDSNLASVKYVLEIEGHTKAGESKTLVQTMGYFSMIFEDGRWRIYAIQFFCDPRIPSFNFDQERGNWPDFDKQVQLVSYDPANSSVDARWITNFNQPLSVPVQTGSTVVQFDKNDWERRVMDGWNHRDASIILSTFSKIYNEVGVSRAEAIQPVSGFFQRFSKLNCLYRVLAFRQFAGRNLATVKAVMEMTGVPTGQHDPVMLIQTMGYASLIYEDGQWRMYASQLFYSPKVPSFNFQEEKGNWPSWGTVVDLKPY